LEAGVDSPPRGRVLVRTALAALAVVVAVAAANPPEAEALVCQKPTVAGSPQVGRALTATAGRCLPGFASTLEWYRCAGASEASCTALVQSAGASPSSYTPTAADVGGRIGVKQVSSLGLLSATNWALPAPAVAPPPVRLPAPGAGGGAPPGPRVWPMLSPLPVIKVTGRLTRRGARVTRLLVRAPSGAVVAGRCRGRGCPARTARTRIRRGGRARLRRFEGHFRGGTALDLLVAKRGHVGKFTRFQFRRGRAPLRTDLCVVPGARSATRCPR
jgi:hypothetical protein